ncbi:MAG: DUF6339 family protein [Isosphaeraceae bacterium]
MSILKGLAPAARVLVSDRAFRTGEAPHVDATPYLVEDLGLGREIPLAPLRAVVARAMGRFKPGESDAWLAPRVHATLRLTRREAADRRIWESLAVVELPDYVRWRWRNLEDDGPPVPIDRFLGDEATNALSRLWWAAELTRNAADYGPTVKMLASPRFSESWLRLDLMHHRAAALAVVDLLGSGEDETAATDAGPSTARAVDVALRTSSLDSLAPDPATDVESVREWCDEHVDETLMFRRLPAGPDEAPVPAEDVAAVRGLLDRLIRQSGGKGARTRRRGRAKASRASAP